MFTISETMRLKVIPEFNILYNDSKHGINESITQSSTSSMFLVVFGVVILVKCPE